MGSNKLAFTLASALTRLTREAPPPTIISLMADRLHDLLGSARIEIWLCGSENGSPLARASAGGNSAGRVRYPFSEPIPLNHGYILVEVTNPDIDLEPLPAALVMFVDELGAHLERVRARERRKKFLAHAAQTRPELADGNAVPRASCLMAKARGIAPRDGWMCLLAESALTERTLDSVAKEILTRPVLRG